MLNPYSQHEELGARVTDVLLKVRLSKLLTEDEMAALTFACGVSVSPRRATLQRLQQMLEDAQCQAASDEATITRYRNMEPR
jgi:hypothetical protein